MKFCELIDGLDFATIQGDPETEIKGIACDSREIEDGWAFVALKGATADGHDYISQALGRGASVICAEKEIPGCASGAYATFGDNPRQTMALLARRVAGNPDLQLRLIGVTGTNGKTTTTMIVRQLLRASGLGCGLIGTVFNAAGGLEIEATRTSPESTALFRWIRKGLDAGDTAMAIEVSSHALELARVHGVSFKVGLFTNLTQDHLDFHDGMEAYYLAKAKLFAQCGCGLANIDDDYGQRLLAENPGILSYGLKVGDYHTENLALRHDGTSFTFVAPKYSHIVKSPLLGRFNAYNLLAALAALDAAGFDLAKLLPSIGDIKGAPGRLERVDMGQPFGVMVDYAHTPDALLKLLAAGKDLLPPCGRLHVLFGCGGDRDRSKRPLMASAVVEGGADVIWHTSDNTRTENPERILDDAALGIDETVRVDANRYHRVADRALAVEAAIRDCRPGDLLLLAGKGHEPYQEVMGVKHPYSDRAAVEAAIKGKDIPRSWDAEVSS